jgi:fibronectin type 3 domain-containing protein
VNADRFGKSKAVPLPSKLPAKRHASPVESLERRVLLSANLTHEYPFTFGTVADNVGAAPGQVAGGAAIQSTGTAAGATGVTTAGAGLQLPGTGTQGVNQNYASIPASDLSGLTSGTIEGWFTVGTTEASSKVFMAGQNASSYIAVTASNGTSGEAQLAFKAAGSMEVDTPSTTYALTPGTEYYFAAVVDASAQAMSFYVGTGGSESLVGSVSLATANAGSPGNLSSINFATAYLGRSLSANPDFNGSIQDLRIYNGALTSAQIAADAASGPDAPLTNTDPFGVGGSVEASADYNTYLPAVEAAGAAWFRAAEGPASPSQGVWDWTAADIYNATVKSDDMYQTGMLSFYLPTWLAATDPNQLTYVNTPAELSWYSSYVTQSVQHLKGQVAQWEIGNEPQNSNISPAGYAAIVETAYNAAKAVDPNAQIGLSVASADVNYIQQVIQAGAANHFDFIIVHPYELAGTISDGEEADYLHVVSTIHTMLAAVDPSKANAPVWVTEVGIAATPGNMPQLVSQAQNLWQDYTMGIAEGFAHIDWFDAQGADPYDDGLLTASGTPNPAYYALQSLTGQLGTDPNYLGWVQLNGTDYGFVFQGASGIVMATWAPPGNPNTVNFGQNVQVLSVDSSTGNIDTTTTSSYALQPETPILVSGLSATNSIVVTAEADANQPLPWNGNHTNSTSVSVTLGATNTENGVHQLDATSTSTAATFDGTPARFAGISPYQTFAVDPNFLAYTPTPIEISVVVGSAPGAGASFDLTYESTDPSKFSTVGPNYITDDGAWHTLNFAIYDDQFDSIYGYNFGLSSDSTSESQYYIQSVTVTKLPVIAAPSDLTATAASSSQINLSWNPVAGAASYEIYRTTTAGGESATPSAIGITGTSYTDTLLNPGTPYYYTVEAVEGVAHGTASNEASGTTSAGIPVTPVQLTGTPSASTTASWNNSSSNYLAVFDGNTNTYFDAPTGNGLWVQLDLGSASAITSIAFAPRVGFEYRMLGGIFEASNDPTFATGIVKLLTVSSTPADGLTNQTVTPNGNFRYVRYLAPTGSYGNIAEMQVFGISGAVVTLPTAPGTPTLSSSTSTSTTFAWTASPSAGVTSYIVLRNGLQIATTSALTYTDSLLSPSTSYSYTIQAVASGVDSPASGALSVTTPPSSITAPGTPTLSSSTSTSAVLAWTASPSAGVTGYIVLRNGAQIGTTLSSTLTYTDSPLTPSTSYTYTVEAVAGSVVSAPSGTLSVTTPAASTGTSGQLIGTPSANTTASWNNDGSNYLTVFDGNTSTYFDSPYSDGNWVQLDLGAAATITSIAYAPRVGFESRTVGGIFEASNDPTFTTGVVTLLTITSSPADGLTAQTVSPGGNYRYLRYAAPSGSYGNIAEMQVFGTTGTGSGPTVPTAPGTPTLSTSTSTSATLAWTASPSAGVTGYIVLRNGAQIGTTSNSTLTYTDRPLTPSTAYTYTVEAIASGVDSAPSGTLSLTTPATAAPTAPGTPTLSSSNSTSATFVWTASTSTGITSYIVLRNGTQIGTTPSTTLTYTDSPLIPSTTYTYTVEAVASGLDSTASGTLSVTTPAASTGTSSQLTGTPSASTTASWNNDGSNYQTVFDGNTSTYFDSPYSDGNWVQLDLGSARTITSIAYAPRVGFESRMVGGIFEASNDPTFGSGVTVLDTLSSTPADGITSAGVSVTGTFRYVRYVAPAGSNGNIAEMQVFGY